MTGQPPAGFRLSHRQRELWRARDADVPLCTLMMLDLGEHVEPGTLRSALRAVTSRHSALRTSFQQVQGARLPLQVVSDGQDPGWTEQEGAITHEVLDRLWRDALPAPGAPAEHVPSAIVTPPLPDGRRRLIVRLSALTADAAGAMIVASELGQAYMGRLPGGDQVAQYVQFSDWQHEMLASESGDAGLAYWQRAVDATVASPALPLQRPLAGARQAADRPLAPAIHDQLTNLADAHGSSLDAIMFAAWLSLLLRLTGAPRLTVFRTLDGRRDADLQGAVGPFGQPVPVTVTRHGPSGFADILAQAEHASREHSRWLDWLTAGDSAAARGSFAFESVTWPGTSCAAEQRFNVSQVRVGGLRHDVTMVFHDATPPRIELHYRQQQFTGEDAQTLLDQFQLMLAGVAAAPDAPLESVALTTERELTRIARASQPTATPAIGDLAGLLGRHATTTPGRPATSCGDVVLSYAGLEERANKAAHVLRSRGMGPGAVCAFMHEHGVQVLEGLLGILKSGAAYLPIDPRWPAERVSAILTDAGPDLLLTQERLAHDLALGQPLPTLCLDRDADLFQAAPSAPPVPERHSPDELAYIIYTSGSTGTPKGVCVTRAGLANYLQWCARNYLLDGVSLVHSSIAFDLTVTSMLAPLAGGGCVRFASPEGFEGLARAIPGDADIGLVKLTPAHLRLLKRMLPEHYAGRFPRELVIGGEALAEQDLAPWRDRAPRPRIFNEYGPTETVVGCCVHEATDPGEPGAVPIGRPIANTSLYVLDDTLRPAPLGVPGELFIGGAGVARGYHKRPGLTAERFVPDPFSAKPGARMYRSGDVVRYRPDGNLEFLGRADDQEQVNGFRVEPSEIEATLVLHDQVTAAAVTVRRDPAGVARILAAIVPAGDAPDPADLNRFLRARLPDYMIPSAIVPLAALPLTPNGKVNRAALPDPDRKARARKGTSGRAGTVAEKTVARIWEDVLNIDDIGAEDNFLDLGGNSFLLLDVAVRLQAEFGVEVTALMLLEHPTVSAIARVLTDGPEAAPGPAAGQGGQDGQAPASHGDGSDPDVTERVLLARQAMEQARARHAERRDP